MPLLLLMVLLDFKYFTSSSSSSNEKRKVCESFKHTMSEQLKKAKNTGGCFICNGPHKARDCLKKEKINALVVETSREEASNGNESDPSWMVPFQLLNVMIVDKLM